MFMSQFEKGYGPLSAITVLNDITSSMFSEQYKYVIGAQTSFFVSIVYIQQGG